MMTLSILSKIYLIIEFAAIEGCAQSICHH